MLYSNSQYAIFPHLPKPQPWDLTGSWPSGRRASRVPHTESQNPVEVLHITWPPAWDMCLSRCQCQAMSPDTGSVALMASALLPRLKSREWKENKSPSPKQTLSDTLCLYNLSLLAGTCGVVPAGIPTQGYSSSPSPAILLTRDVFLSRV